MQKKNEAKIKEFVQEFLDETNWDKYDQMINYNYTTELHVYTDWDGTVRCSVFDVDNGRRIKNYWTELNLN